MKTCPACGTQYEDHVPQCFVDGTSLNDIPVEEAGRFDGGTAPSTTREDAPGPVSEQPAPQSRGATSIIAFLGLLSILLGVGLVGIVLFVLTRTEAPPGPTPVPVPVIAPPEPPPPAPEPPAPTVLSVGITSTPPGAEVWEGSSVLCVTPCSIEHPEHAPLPRSLVLKAENHLDTPYQLDDPRLPHHVPLQVKAAPVRPTPRPARPSPGPAPTPTPAAPKPSPRPSTAPAIELER